MREFINGFSKCPLCEGDTALEYSVNEGDELSFQAVCSNEACGCKSAKFPSIKALQERWNTRSGLSRVMHNAYDILPTMQESVVETRDDNARLFRIVRVQRENKPDLGMAYYDGKNFTDIFTKQVIPDVEAWTIFDGAYFEAYPPVRS